MQKPQSKERIVIDANWTLGRITRLITTGLSFFLFGVGGILMALIWFPAINLVVRDKEKRAKLARLSVHKAWRFYIDFMQFMGTVSYETENIELLENCRGVIVVANHPTLLDVVFLMAFMRHTRAVVKQGVWNNPFMSGVVKACDYIPNLGNPEKLIEDCSDALKNGANLCIFPEGSRTPEGEAAVYQRGFARVALEARAPILTVAIDVSTPTLRKNEPWYSIPKKKAHWKIKVLELIETTDESEYKRTAIGVRALTKDVQDRIERELSL